MNPTVSTSPVPPGAAGAVGGGRAVGGGVGRTGVGRCAAVVVRTARSGDERQCEQSREHDGSGTSDGHCSSIGWGSARSRLFGGGGAVMRAAVGACGGRATAVRR